MKQYYRVLLGKKSLNAEECFQGNMIGISLLDKIDLSGKLPDNWRAFNQEFIPHYLEAYPEKSRIAAGMACGALWTLAKGIQAGDLVLSPTGSGEFRTGTVRDAYAYHQGEPLPHQRKVEWHVRPLTWEMFSDALKSSFSSSDPVCNISKHEKELEELLSGNTSSTDASDTGEVIENLSEFAFEKHLEDFLVKNWAQTELGMKYDIYMEEGELAGQQYATDTGAIDILAISKDKKELLVVELKRGRASDNVVGQIQRYMGYVMEELAEEGQTVKGTIIAFEDDLRIRRALRVAPNIEFYRYLVNFKLFKC